MAYSACFHDNTTIRTLSCEAGCNALSHNTEILRSCSILHTLEKGVKNPNEKVYEVFLQLAKVFCTRQNAHTVCNGMLLVSEKTTSGDFLSTATTKKKIGCNHVLVSYFLFCNELQSTCTEYYSLE